MTFPPFPCLPLSPRQQPAGRLARLSLSWQCKPGGILPAVIPLPDERFAARRAEVSVARALGSTTRAAIYEHLQSADRALTTRDVAATFDLHPNVARTHLELLADAGLVVVGRRKQPGGGRPAKIYAARAGADVAPAASGPDGTALLAVKLLVTLLDRAPAPQAGRFRWESAEAVAAGEGRALAAATPRTDGPPTLIGAAQTAVRALRDVAPRARVVGAAADWVDVAGVRDLFASLAPVPTDLAAAFDRGLLVGALAGAGAPATVAAGPAPTGGDPVFRARAAGPVSARPVVASAATVDARGIAREAGVAEAMRAVTALEPGDVLEILAEGPGSPAAFARWADRAGHRLLAVERVAEAGGHPAIRLLLRKGT